MSGNSSSTWNSSLSSHLDTSQIAIDRLCNCLTAKLGVYAMNTGLLINVLVLFPLCIFIFHLVHKQWRQHGSTRRMSHSDLFTFHLTIMEVINIFSVFFCFCGINTNLKTMTVIGVYLYPVNFCGQLLFHTLTCVERYIAAVHPVTYLGLRNTNGIRARNVLIVCVWLLCVAVVGCMLMTIDLLIIIASYCVVSIALIIISFCSVSVLCTLIHPKPGEGGGDKQQADQPKMRAFSTIMVILGVLVLRFGANIVICVLGTFANLEEAEKCGVLLSDFVFSLPCSFVLPLLFLHKAGKLKCGRRNSESTQRSD